MYKVLILEDESYTLRFIQKIIADHPLVSKIIPTSNSKDAIDMCIKHLPEIILLDIELEQEDDLNGIEVAKRIKKINNNGKFVFITGYSNYALDSFVVHPFDYILKPIVKERLYELITELSKEIKTQQEAIVKIRVKNSICFLKCDDIFYIEKHENNLNIITDKEIIQANCKLKDIQENLPNTFVRVHKSFIVNTTKIKKINYLGNRTYEIEFNNIEQKALMSRNKFKELEHLFSPMF
ncbi:hypothetical protein SYNTR_2296 [Candidatus Syntrophocurvum alkaliphilum]|uniref:Stage 0 sporulation protein A homolog n=1 Tax=Candidatus Syntrophocurvum alkaliphilum TaxID=2293317 RepID=A0A6I6DMF8_9FIRM|nr:LytTR family DNA-binding domain-containing protein [Candidatus Syntrophocurvum alkaliphilum]QGU00890.1 hypothetical protein SYNTR_2296 [Candidatus Syntrophocurvum alkaliphilum]